MGTDLGSWEGQGKGFSMRAKVFTGGKRECQHLRTKQSQNPCMSVMLKGRLGWGGGGGDPRHSICEFRSPGPGRVEPSREVSPL